MEELLTRLTVDLAGRVDGPLWLRLLMQPSVACLLAIRDARSDVDRGRPPYGWALLTAQEPRRSLFREAWQSVGKVFLLAATLDVVYQWIVFRFVYPGEALLVAATLALLPYALMRGVANRALRRFGRRVR